LALLLCGDAAAEPYLTVKDHPGDNGSQLDLTLDWSGLQQLFGSAIDSVVVERRDGAGDAWTRVAALPATQSEYTDGQLSRDTAYAYRITAFRAGAEPAVIQAGDPVKPVASLFNGHRTNALVLVVLFSLAVLLYIRAAKGGRATYIRPISGLEAVEDGVGRATEMGRPVLFIPGTGDVDDVQTLAGLSVLSRIAKVTATYDTPLMVPCLYPMPLAAAGEVVRQAYLDAGKPEAFHPDMVRYMAGESFGFAAAVNGWMVREKPATNIFLGNFAAESLLLAETGNAAGAIQIAGTAQPEQLPFFIAACDYTLLGEELYAASAYLSHEPKFLGSLKAQDLFKILLAAVILGGAILATFELPLAHTLRDWFSAS
jgi:hypothetical protein